MNTGLDNIFPHLPEKAALIRSVSDVIYDASLRIAVNYNHIFIDRMERLPISFFEENGPKDFDYSKLRIAENQEKKTLYKSLKKTIFNDEESQKMLCYRLDYAIDLAKSKAGRNFKEAVPIYNPKRDSICLLLPLSLTEENKTDVALVISRSETSDNYCGVTILELGTAYKSARLISGIEGQWMPEWIVNQGAGKSQDPNDSHDNEQGLQLY